jgi:hypothetical protein
MRILMRMMMRIVYAHCGAMSTVLGTVQTAAVPALESWLTSVFGGKGTWAYVQTPASDPCRFVVDSSGGSPSATGLGESTAMCPWDAELRDESLNAETLAGEWWGTRL